MNYAPLNPLNTNDFKSQQDKIVQQASKARQIALKELREENEMEYRKYMNDQADRMADGSDEQGYDIENKEESDDTQ